MSDEVKVILKSFFYLALSLAAAIALSAYIRWQGGARAVEPAQTARPTAPSCERCHERTK